MTRDEIIMKFRDSMIKLMAKELPDEQWFKQAYDIFVLARDREIFWEKIQKIHDDLRLPS